MADLEVVERLLEGAFDTHVHSSPDIQARKMNDLEVARRFSDRQMGGFVLKSHYVCTADRATLVREMFPDVQVFGGLTLNNSVGGFNPLAVDVAGRLGNKVVWFPTVNSQNERDATAHETDPNKLPSWMPIARELQALGVAGSWLAPTDDDGKVREAVRQCLELIGKYDMVLATGHIRPVEMLPVVEAAREAGVQRIIITHPEHPTTLLSIEQQKALAAHGVFFERCFTTAHNHRIEWDVLLNNIREIGVGSTLASTDLGQVHNPPVDEGIALYYARLLDNGFTEADVRQMGTANPKQVLGAT